MDRRVRKLSVMATLFVVLVAVPWAPATDQVASQADVQAPESEWINSTAHINTDHGTIIVELADEDAPITVGNFITLADLAFYNNMRWHRVVDDFVIQTGDPNSRDQNPYNDGTGGSTQTIPLEIHENLTHEDGAIGMARSSEPDSASSQFYICDGAQNGLDGNYAVFGYVVEGMDVVRSIASVEVYGNTRPVLSQHPVEDVWLYSVRVTPGYYNETDELPDGPTGATVSGGGVTGAGLVAMAVVVAVPLVIIPIAFVMFRQAQRRGEK
ncbi:MAG: peptidylprolyl isomerase [Thermoplasmata archaeon]|nr:MAG: peptidylprolyl isomerase [Thermoplasmata archaeon]